MLVALLLCLATGPVEAQNRQFFSGPLAPATPPALGQTPTDGVAQYQFGYKTEDPAEATYSQQRERRDGDSVTGFYSLLLPDGRVQVVNYVADSGGYRASVSYQTPEGRALPQTQPTPGTAPQAPDFQFTGPLPPLTTGLGTSNLGDFLVKRQVTKDEPSINRLKVQGFNGNGGVRAVKERGGLSREQQGKLKSSVSTRKFLQGIGTLPLSREAALHPVQSVPLTLSSGPHTTPDQHRLLRHSPQRVTNHPSQFTDQPEHLARDEPQPLTAQLGGADGWTPLSDTLSSRAHWPGDPSSGGVLQLRQLENSSPEARSWLVADPSLPVSGVSVSGGGKSAVLAAGDDWKIASDGDFRSVAVQDREGSWTVLAPRDDLWRLTREERKGETKVEGRAGRNHIGEVLQLKTREMSPAGLQTLQNISVGLE